MANKKPHFSGYATKANIKCSDDLVIKPGAFAHQDGAQVPLVFMHDHKNIANVLGHVVLENRKDGVFCHGYLNASKGGNDAKEALKNGDLNSLSVYATGLTRSGNNIMHGEIKEVSLVLAGANPGALIESVAIQHSDGGYEELDDECIMHFNITFDEEESEDDLEQADTSGDKTVKEIYDSMTPEQQGVVHYLVSEVMKKDDEVEQDGLDADDEGGNEMKTNAFEKQGNNTAAKGQFLTHADFKEICKMAYENKLSLKHACTEYMKNENKTIAHASMEPTNNSICHAVTYGIENIGYLLPDVQQVGPIQWIKRDDAWVKKFLGGCSKSPFNRIKTLWADITADTARAKGYLKGGLKIEEFFALAKRETTPFTIYKKQKLDRDDIIDIDFAVVNWLKQEMMMMLQEEAARAALVGDGRTALDQDKIDPTKIRPIYSDDPLFAIRSVGEAAETDAETLDRIVMAQETYEGSNPVMFCTRAQLMTWLLLKDQVDSNRRLYKDTNELAAALNVSDIIEAPVMAGVSRVDGLDTIELQAIIVNLSDYTIGAMKGGETSLFDDFDIDYNQFKYLAETRFCGALTKLKSAVIIEKKLAGN